MVSQSFFISGIYCNINKSRLFASGVNPRFNSFLGLHFSATSDWYRKIPSGLGFISKHGCPGSVAPAVAKRFASNSCSQLRFFGSFLSRRLRVNTSSTKKMRITKRLIFILLFQILCSMNKETRFSYPMV